MIPIWIVTTEGFISLVQDRKDSRMLQVRARVRKDIENIFPSALVYASEGGDYRYRARISKERVALRLAEMVLEELTYESHFKDVALAKDPGNPTRRTAYYGTWNAMAGMQDYAPYSKVSRAQQAANAAAVRAKGVQFGRSTADTYGYQDRYRTDDRPYWMNDDFGYGTKGAHRPAGTSKIDQREAATEPESADDVFARQARYDEIWGPVDIDSPTAEDIAEWERQEELEDDRPLRGQMSVEEIEALEEAFGVETETMTDDDLADLWDQLQQMHLPGFAVHRTQDTVPEVETDTEPDQPIHPARPGGSRAARRNRKRKNRRDRKNR